MVRQRSVELAVIDPAQGQRRQRTQPEPADLEGLERRGRRSSMIANACC
jgi:hypothetical protein